eukprot:COSAG02_NODE_38314_length_430_cov_1.256798_1_plen_118_part_10
MRARLKSEVHVPRARVEERELQADERAINHKIECSVHLHKLDVLFRNSTTPICHRNHARVGRRRLMSALTCSGNSDFLELRLKMWSSLNADLLRWKLKLMRILHTEQNYTGLQVCSDA